MPVKPDSRFAALTLFSTVAPDGSTRQVIAQRFDVAPGTATQSHRLVQGEALDLLARRLYGDERLWWKILDANSIRYPLDLEPGDVIDLPDPGPATRVTRARSF